MSTLNNLTRLVVLSCFILDFTVSKWLDKTYPWMVVIKRISGAFNRAYIAKHKLHLIPMLRTKPEETRSSIACQVVSRDMVVSMSRTPSSPKALEVLPTPACMWNISKLYQKTFKCAWNHLLKSPNKIIW